MRAWLIVAPTFRIDPLKEFLPGNIGAAPHQPGQSGIADADAMENAAFAPELQVQGVPRHAHMTIAERGEAERVVRSCVLLVADSHECLIEQSNERREDAVAR